MQALYSTIETENNLKLMTIDGVLVKCHKQVLEAVSPFFDSMFSF